MKFTAQEEYGLRCLLQFGRQPAGGSLTIPEISQRAGLSEPYVAKLLRILRQGKLITSIRGQAGGYALARPPERILVGEVLSVLGGRLFDGEFCDNHPGHHSVCNLADDCALRSLWRTVQVVVDQVLNRTSLKDLLASEQQMENWAGNLVTITSGPAESAVPAAPPRRV